MKDVLIHTCCAPCFVSVEDHFKDADQTVAALFFNPFIHPFKEYQKRLKSMAELEKIGIEVHYIDEYDLRDFLITAITMEKRGEKRCTYCYRVRLEATARKAKELGITKFTTTLIVSPYQDIDLINRMGEDIGQRNGVEYIPLNLTHMHDEGHEKAREMGLYMQNYCGCIFSEEERFKKALIKK